MLIRTPKMSLLSLCSSLPGPNITIPAASMVLEQGARITPFVRPWSTMTITESKPEETGRSVMRLTESCLKGRDGGRDWTERRNSEMSVNCVLLTNSATSNKMLDKGGQAWPPEIVFKDRLGVEDSHVP